MTMSEFLPSTLDIKLRLHASCDRELPLYPGDVPLAWESGVWESSSSFP